VGVGQVEFPGNDHHAGVDLAVNGPIGVRTWLLPRHVLLRCRQSAMPTKRQTENDAHLERAHTGCQVMLCRHGHRLRVEVDDESSQLPAMRTFPDETGGWGLRLLAALSHDWGTERRPWGKSVWFVI
jgi:hypothetical protein